MYKIENFSFTYPKDKKIINNISFEILPLSAFYKILVKSM